MSTDQSGMSQPPWDQPYVSPEGMPPPRKKGLSCGCMLLIVLGIAFLVLALLCCGGIVWMGSYFREAVSEDPEVVAKVTDEIAGIDIPEGLTPQFSLNMKVPFSGEPMMTWVVHVDESTQSMLLLASFGGPLAGQNEEDLMEGIEASLEEQGVHHEESVGDWKKQEKEIQVRGQPVTFHFATGEDGSGKKRIQVTGTFQGAKGPTMLSFSGDAEKYDEETIVQMIESIR
jgi:hypothetical protein